jgi:hypothetical protein
MMMRGNLNLSYYHLFLDYKLNLRPVTEQRTLVGVEAGFCRDANLHLAARAEVKLIDACPQVCSVRLYAIDGEHAHTFESTLFDYAG